MQEIKNTKQESGAQCSIKVKELDISDEQCVFCPQCKGTNVSMDCELPGSFLTIQEAWKCKDCGKEFSIRLQTHLVWEESHDHI